jgi:hypothetical protein
VLSIPIVAAAPVLTVVEAEEIVAENGNPVERALDDGNEVKLVDGNDVEFDLELDEVELVITDDE